MTRCIGLTTFLVAAALIGVSFIGASDGTKEWPCYSIAESKTRGCFVCSLALTQSTFMHNGKKAAIKEAWIERCLKRGPILGMASRPTQGFNICFTYAKGCEFYPTFYLLEGSSFRSNGTVIAYQYVEKVPDECNIRCDLGDKNTVTFKATSVYKGR